jgi:hypothetical protein
MNKLLAAGLVVGSLVGATSAHALPQIGIEIYVDGTLDDASGLQTGGSVALNDLTNSLFSSISVSSLGVPATPDPNFGTISINARSSFLSGSHTLTLIATQTGLSGTNFGQLSNTFTYNGLFNAANVSSSIGANYVDASDTAFAETTLMASTPDEGGQITYASPVFTYGPTPAPLFSETEVYTFTFIGVANTESSAQITGVPEPISLALLGTGLLTLGVVRSRRG